MQMRQQNFPVRPAAWIAAALGATATVSAPAQQGPADASAELEEIVVTAQKRAESLHDVPLAVTAVSGDALEASRFTSLNDLQFLAPTLQYTGGSAPSFQVRGVGTNTFDFAIENSVGVQLDGVPQMLPRSTFVNTLFDIERIEVLRGPQGTLFGKNTSAGVMTVSTGTPVMGERSNRLHLAYGSYGELEVSDVFNVPVGESLAWRTSATFRRRDGYVHNRFTGDDIYGRRDYSLNSKLLWQATERTRALLVADYQRHNDDGYYAWTIRTVGNQLAAGSPPILYIPRNYIAQTVATYGITPGPDNLEGAWNSPIYNKTRNTGLTLQLDVDLGANSLTSITGWRKGKYDGSMDSDSSPYPFYEQNLFLLDGKQYTQELRLASAERQRFEYVVGAFYSRFIVDAETLQTGTFGIVPETQPIRVTSSALGGASVFDVDNDNYALFGQGTLRMTETDRLIIGARTSRDLVDSRFHVEARPGICQRTFATTGNCYSTVLAPLVGQSPKRTGWSGKLGYQHEFSSTVNSYATVSRGYKGVSVNNVNGASTVVEPETSLNYELGLKAELFDRRFSANLAAYHTHFKNFQAQTLFVINGVNQYSIGNAGGLTVKGLELEMAARPIAELTLSASVIFNDSRFTDFVTQCYPLQTVALGCVTPPGSAAQFQAKGQPLTNAPRFTSTLAVGYTRPVGRGLEFTANANAAHKGRVYYQVGNPATIQGGYAIVNANVGLQSVEGGWGVSAYVRNLLDKHYVSLINPLIGTVGGYHNRPAENAVRTVGVSVDWRFGNN
jgi:iron complex outermembrane recepter protein